MDPCTGRDRTGGPGNRRFARARFHRSRATSMAQVGQIAFRISKRAFRILPGDFLPVTQSVGPRRGAERKIRAYSQSGRKSIPGGDGG